MASEGMSLFFEMVVKDGVALVRPRDALICSPSILIREIRTEWKPLSSNSMPGHGACPCR